MSTKWLAETVVLHTSSSFWIHAWTTPVSSRTFSRFKWPDHPVLHDSQRSLHDSLEIQMAFLKNKSEISNRAVKRRTGASGKNKTYCRDKKSSAQLLLASMAKICVEFYQILYTSPAGVSFSRHCLRDASGGSNTEHSIRMPRFPSTAIKIHTG